MPQSWTWSLAQLCGVLTAIFLVWFSSAAASTYSVYSIRVDRWLPESPDTPVFGTAYTAGGLKLGTPPGFAVGLTAGGQCAPRPSDTPCVASWGTGPPGPGTSRSGRLLLLGAGSSKPPVWVFPGSWLSVYGESRILPTSMKPLDPGYSSQNRYYSYYNRLGILLPDHPYAPTTATTVYAATHTTRSGGNYGSRPGTIRVEPGPRRFGGTMRMFYGPGNYSTGRAERPGPNEHATYTAHAVRIRSNSGIGATGPFGPNPPTYNTRMGPQVLGETGTYGSTYIRHETLTVMGDPLTYQYWFFATRGPWTTGMVTIYGTGSEGPFSLRATGYDTRGLTPGGALSGALSLVQPVLLHNYAEAGAQPSFHSAQIVVAQMEFLPEPGASGLLSVGLLSLVLLYRMRRREPPGPEGLHGGRPGSIAG